MAVRATQALPRRRRGGISYLKTVLRPGALPLARLAALQGLRPIGGVRPQPDAPGSPASQAGLTPLSAIAPDRLQQPASDRARLLATGGPAAATEPRGRGNDRSVEARRGRLEFFVRRTASCEILRGRFPPAPIPEIPTLRTGTSKSFATQFAQTKLSSGIQYPLSFASSQSRLAMPMSTHLETSNPR